MITRRAAVMTVLALAAPMSARAQASPVANIQAFAQALQTAMKSGKAVPFAQRAAALRQSIVKLFDLEAILKASVGVHYAAIPPTTRGALLEAFTGFTVASWVANFDAYDGERFEVLPETRKVGGDEIVQMRIVPRSGEATRLDYVMRNTDGAWRAVDILVDGSVSRVAIQRSDFRSILAKGDDALVALLKSKTADLQAGVK